MTLKKRHNFLWKIRIAVFRDDHEHEQLKVSSKIDIILFGYIQVHIWTTKVSLIYANIIKQKKSKHNV